MTINVTELKELLDAGQPISLVDVREEDEWAICHLPDATLIPLSQFAQRGPAELDPDTRHYLYCHHGMRSQQAQHFLIQKGFKEVINVTGGIDAWSVAVDSSLPRY